MKKAKKLLKTLTGFLFSDAVINIAAVGFLLAFVVSAPQIHKTVMRNYVGNKVVMIKGKTLRGGGTGFFVKAPSGKTFILTNSHVCGLRDKNNNVYVKERGSSTYLPRRIVHDYYRTHDLCLVESFSSVQGLDVASSVHEGDTVGIVGHPKLFPLTMTTGEYIGEQLISLYYPKQGKRYSGTPTLAPSNTKIDIDKIMEDIKKMMRRFRSRFELRTLRASQIIGYSRPGNSGSPIVNFYGNVVAVLFAGNPGDAMETYAVPLETVEEFLANY